MRLSPHFIDLVQDALLKSFWKKKALKTFLQRSHVSESFLAQLSGEETKREWLDRLFGKLEVSERGQALIQQMARTLSEQTTFPDLANWEDSAEKIKAANAAVAALRDYLHLKDTERTRERETAERREAAAEIRKKTARSMSDLVALSERLNALAASLGTQTGGYDFQSWFYDLMDYYEVDNRRPYTSNGRQIDGSITIDGTTYLVELKFTSTQSAATDIDSLFKKVSDKSDNTMGILISMSGFSSVALKEASSSKSPLLLFDHSHLYMILSGVISFPDVVRRVRRHSSQEGEAFLPVVNFGG
jgi:hypothetical protein